MPNIKNDVPSDYHANFPSPLVPKGIKPQTVLTCFGEKAIIMQKYSTTVNTNYKHEQNYTVVFFGECEFKRVDYTTVLCKLNWCRFEMKCCSQDVLYTRVRLTPATDLQHSIYEKIMFDGDCNLFKVRHLERIQALLKQGVSDN